MHRCAAVLLVVVTVAALTADGLLLDADDVDDQQLENDWPSTYRLLVESNRSPPLIDSDADQPTQQQLEDEQRAPVVTTRLPMAASRSRGRDLSDEGYQVPKRALSLLSRWKTLDQIRRSLPMAPSSASASSLALTHSRHQIKKQHPPLPPSPKEEFQLPPMSRDLITAVARGYQRSLRPPGQPLRWG